ncbi:unnamed protein product [Allacma fusca]|uniref:Gustatory receptor n=1 Tax=Allacma fusca TaxID=39272 RepID=A0A8J2NQL4_9HEXA|nr:unnamed protein product [Allacma fusca]
MEQILKPLLFFSDFRNIFHVRLKSKSVLENFYPLAIFGHILGFFPIKSILPGFREVRLLEFTFFSYPVLYTICLNGILYFFTLEASFAFYKDSFRFKFSTDDFALKVFFFMFSVSKICIHFITIIRVPNIIGCFKSIETYDLDFEYKNHTLILSRYVVIFLVGTIISAVLSLVATFSKTWSTVIENYELSSKVGSNVERFWSLTILPEPLIVTVLGLITHVIAESAIFFSQSTIAYIVNCICDRIQAIETEILEIHSSFVHIDNDKNPRLPSNELSDVGSDNERANNRVTTIWIQPTSFLSEQNLNTELKRSVRRNGKRFVRLMDVVQDLNSVANEIIVISSTASTVIIVSLCYLIVMFFSQWDATTAQILIGVTFKNANFIVSSTIILIVALTVGRLVNFANTGEKLQNSVTRLGTTMKRFDHTDNAEINRYCCYLYYLISSSDASLTGCGFFRLNRAALTSILAPVITFIVILAQFRVSDIQLSGSHTNATMV